MTDTSSVTEPLIADLTRQAESGDVDAGIVLSRELMKLGRFDESFEWLVRTAKGGHPIAASDLGLRLSVGAAAPYDPPVGVKWLEAASKAGFAEAQRWLALHHAAGHGVAQDFAIALSCLQGAAKGGDASAIAQMQVIVASGITNPETLLEFLQPSTPELLYEVPRVTVHREALPPVMCNWWIMAAKSKLEPARVRDADAGGRREDAMRTNMGTGFSFLETDVVMQLGRARIAQAVGRPMTWQEAPNVLHYDVGQRYEPHYDFLDPTNTNFAEEIEKRGQRITTALVYLNQNFAEGQTWFDYVKDHVRVPTGAMIAFDNTLRDGSPDMNTLHAGLAPTEGEKWLLSIWIRNRDQQVV